MVSQGMGQLSRYGWLGGSPSEVFRNLITQPLAILGVALFEMKGWVYLGVLLLPLAMTPLIGIEFLLPAGADLAANLLSANPMPRSIFAYHSVAMVPLLVVAGMWGARRLSRFDRYSVTGLGRLVLILTGIMTYRVLPLPLPGAVNIWGPTDYRLRPEPSLEEVREILGPVASVSAQANVVPHFTHREDIRVFPEGTGEVDCLVMNLSSPTSHVQGADPGDQQSLAHHLDMAPSRFLSSVSDVVSSVDYSVRYWRAPWAVFCRGGLDDGSAGTQILREIQSLRREWGVQGVR
jgi:hypothetical protein